MLHSPFNIFIFICVNVGGITAKRFFMIFCLLVNKMLQNRKHKKLEPFVGFGASGVGYGATNVGFGDAGMGLGGQFSK